MFTRIFSGGLWTPPGQRPADFGAVLMNGVKRGLFSNEAGSGSAPCAAAAAEKRHPSGKGQVILQAFGVFVDTPVISTCTALIMLLAPAGNAIDGAGRHGNFSRAAMSCPSGTVRRDFYCGDPLAVQLHHLSRNSVLCPIQRRLSVWGPLGGPDRPTSFWPSTMLFIGGLAAYTFVWDLGDVGIGLMTIFNLIALLPLSKEALASLKDFEQRTHAY